MRALILLGVVVGGTLAGRARAWEAVHWPATVCSAIDPAADHNLIYMDNGVLDNYNRTETYWSQCPVRTPPGLAIVRCAQPAPPSWAGRNWPASSIVSVKAPGDGDTERHHWPGTMCRPSFMQDLESSAGPTEDMDVLYNSGGAIANMNTRTERLVVCPVPLPAETSGHKISIYWQGRFLTGVTRFCRLVISGYQAAQGGRADILWSAGFWQDSVKEQTIDVTLPQFVADNPWKINANVTCSLAANGEFGPAGITSYTTQIDVAPADAETL